MNKKIVVFFLSFFVLGCTSQSSLDVGSWKIAGELPAPQGFTESIGVAGAYAEFIGEYLVVAGGSNFPYKLLVEGGRKEFYSDIFVFKVNADKTITQVGSGMLPKKLGGGATIVADGGMYLIGGENVNEESSSIYFLSLDGTMPIVEEKAKLPFTWALGAAVIKENILYLFAGRNNKTATSKSWAFNMDLQTIEGLAPLPAEPRIQMPFVSMGNKVYLMNGLSLGFLTLTDNYVYDITANQWKKLSDTTLNGEPFTVAGGAAIPLSDNILLAIGGVNKEVFEYGVTQGKMLQGDELKAFNKEYQGMPAEDFKFSKQKMVYDIAQNKWSSLGELPFIGGAGPFPLLNKDDTVWHISGEIKAGVRQPLVRTGMVQK